MPDPYVLNGAFPGIIAIVFGALITIGVAWLYQRWQDKNERAYKAKMCNTRGTADGWSRHCTLPVGHEGPHLDRRKTGNDTAIWDAPPR